jgi:hypothetical protein
MLLQVIRKPEKSACKGGCKGGSNEGASVYLVVCRGFALVVAAHEVRSSNCSVKARCLSRL